MKIKLVISIKKWLDRKVGNNYFSAQVFKTDTGESLKIPFGYCSGMSYMQDIRLKLDYHRWNTNDLNDKTLVFIAQVGTMKECKAYGE